jgi:hypothetical protein
MIREYIASGSGWGISGSNTGSNPGDMWISRLRHSCGVSLPANVASSLAGCVIAIDR